MTITVNLKKLEWKTFKSKKYTHYIQAPTGLGPLSVKTWRDGEEGEMLTVELGSSSSFAGVWHRRYGKWEQYEMEEIGQTKLEEAILDCLEGQS